MAKKYGIELRNELKFRDNGGQIINQGDLYLEDQLIAFWSQDMWGGADILKMEKNYSEASFREAILGKHPAPLTIRYGDYVISVEYSLELMMNELVKLTDAENIFHRALDKGYNALLFVTDGGDVQYWALSEEEKYTLDEAMFIHEDLLAESREAFDSDDIEIKYYTSESQFEEGEPIRLDQLI